MNKYIYMVLFFMFLCGCRSEKNLSDSTGNTAKRCALDENHVCVIPFAAVYSIPTYSRKNLYGIKGYLAFEDNEYVIYPNKEAMIYGVKESAVLIRCECDMKSEFFSLYQGEFVGITGYFSNESKHQNSEEYWATINTKRDPNPIPFLNRGPPAITPPPPE
jgi:hypothetical protein